MTDDDTTYIDELQGAGFIPGYPGMHSHGTRIIRNKSDNEIVEVLPPLTIEEKEAQAEAAENPIQVHIAVVDVPEHAPPPQEKMPPSTPITPVAEEAPSETITHDEAQSTEQEASQEPITPSESEAAQ